MKQEHIMILRKLTDFDRNRVNNLLAPHLELETNQLISFNSFTFFLLKNEEGDVKKHLDDFLDMNQYRSSTNFHSQNILDSMPFNFEKMLTNLQIDIEKYENQKRQASINFLLFSRKVLMPGSFLKYPISKEDINEFLDILQQLATIRTTINNYLAVACLIKKAFMFFTWENTTELLKSCGLKMDSPPNGIDGTKYMMEHFDYRFFSSQDFPNN
jgi:hypothetical protein